MQGRNYSRKGAQMQRKDFPPGVLGVNRGLGIRTVAGERASMRIFHPLPGVIASPRNEGVAIQSLSNQLAGLLGRFAPRNDNAGEPPPIFSKEFK
jgi:hypothetical protein